MIDNPANLLAQAREAAERVQFLLDETSYHDPGFYSAIECGTLPLMRAMLEEAARMPWSKMHWSGGVIKSHEISEHSERLLLAIIRVAADVCGEG